MGLLGNYSVCFKVLQPVAKKPTNNKPRALGAFPPERSNGWRTIQQGKPRGYRHPYFSRNYRLSLRLEPQAVTGGYRPEGASTQLSHKIALEGPRAEHETQ